MPGLIQKPRTLYDKVFDANLIEEQPDGSCILAISRHLVHEVTSPQAFEGLRNSGRKVRRPDLTLATMDHNTPTSSRKGFKDISSFVEEADSRLQCETLEENVKAFKLTYFGLGSKNQGIVHVIGPEQGFTLPGTTVVCGDSHTSTHGACGALAFGIGTSEVEHVLATQTLLTRRSKNMKVQVDGELAPGVASKDIVLHIIGLTGTAGGTGHVIEYCGSTIRALSMEARMSICNMSIEGGARAGMIAPDQITYDYLKGRPLAPTDTWDRAVKYWDALKSDPDAVFDKEYYINAKDIAPTVTWGTSPEDTVPITGVVPGPDDFSDPAKKEACKRALKYMGLEAGTKMTDIPIDKVFIGSCTNARIEDLRAAAHIVKGQTIASNIKRAMIVPGSGLVKRQAEKEGLDRVFLDAGFEWREAGCSACLGMNNDQIGPEERCASTSNRNFEGRQGALSRTHLLSPAMAAAAAIVGKLADVRHVTGYDKVTSSAKTTPVTAHQDIESDEDLDNVFDIDETSQGNVVQGAAPSPSGGLEKFTQLKSVAAVIDRANVDTDAIIPKQFLKTIKRSGLAKGLFFESRFKSDGSEIPDFVLNQEPFRTAKVLICTGRNFGCGSSREHAAWALLDYGIRCIIAPSFGDIFATNLSKNGMLTVLISDQNVLNAIADEARSGREIEVDLVAKAVKDSNGNVLATFEMDEMKRRYLLEGLDEIGLTLQKVDLIEKHEQKRASTTPWLETSGYLSRHRTGAVKVEAVPLPKNNRGEEKELNDW